MPGSDTAGVRVRRWRLLIAAASMAAAAAVLTTPSAADRTPADCSPTTLTVERRGETIFRLSDPAGATLEIDPEDRLTVRLSNPPTAGRVKLSVPLPFRAPYSPPQPPRPWSGLPPGADHELTVDLSGYRGPVQHLRGLYQVRAALYSREDPAGERLICEVTAWVRVGGFGGVVPPAATGAAAATGVAAVAAGAWSASGSYANLKARLAIRRRRGRGWRRWIPAPAWRRSITSTLLGVVTGALTTFALQQSGLVALTGGTVVAGAGLGGGVSVGVGLVWGSVFGYLRSLRRPDDERVPPAGA